MSRMNVKENRIQFIDNLRTFMIFLVVLLHSGLVYEGSGFSALFWIVYDPATNNLASFLRIIMDIFIMSTLFFISGFLTPLSLKHKSGLAFIKTKFKRLMIPWLIAVLTLLPLYKIIYLCSRGLPQQPWTSYFHWSNEMWSQNWLWFLPVLFLFDIAYLLGSRVKIRLPEPSLKNAILAVFIIGFIYSVCLDMLHLQGWTKSIVLDFQNERLLIYFMVFLLGSLCHQQKTFESRPGSLKLYIVIVCTTWIPVMLYRYFLLKSLITPGVFVFSEIVDTLLLWLNFHLSLFSLLYIMVNTFRKYLDKKGKLGTELSRNSYPVYIIHTVVMGGLAVILLHIALPSLVKFFLLTATTFAVCNLLIFSYREIRSKLRLKSS